jgi:hypothetical protein
LSTKRRTKGSRIRMIRFIHRMYTWVAAEEEEKKYYNIDLTERSP